MKQITTLGLDLGPNSIGWALIKQSADESTGEIVATGVRVFPEGVDAFDTSKEASRNEQRRLARMMRRQIRRRARRRKVLSVALVEAGLLPADTDEREDVLNIDPYPLRAAALERRLEPFEIGRIIYHLNQRRGFLSLKKVKKAVDGQVAKPKKTKSKVKDTEDVTGNDEAGVKKLAAKKDEDSATLLAIEMLSQKLGDRTLGQALHDQQTQDAPQTTAGQPLPPRIRGQHTNRKMIEDEFMRVWQAQREHHRDLLSETLCFGQVGRQEAMHTKSNIARNHDLTPLQQFGLHGLIFHQRPIYWPREMIGMCELVKGKRRCPRADRRAQRFRMLQEINNLRYEEVDASGFRVEKKLDADQRATLLAKLYTTERLPFDQVRRALKLTEKSKFNLERGERASLKGCETDVRLGKAWAGYADLEEGLKDEIACAVFDATRDLRKAEQKLTGDLGLPPAAADALLTVDLPDEYVNFSIEAINRLMPHLEKGLILMGKSDTEESAMHAAGFLRKDELERRLFDKLPSLTAIRSGPLADLPNPVVRTTLHELRKVVNAIIREYGPPDNIHVEMPRSLKMSGEQRRIYNKKNIKRGVERADIANGLREEKIAPTRDAILKHQLWQQQDERCIYTGRAISFNQLYDGSTDVDHILPYSLTLDDSQANKVVCFRDANRDKGQRSPYEWLAGSDPQRLAEIQQRAAAAKLPWNKQRKITQKEIKNEDFIARQLVDTGYISKLAVTYLQMLTPEAHNVQGRKGTYTSDLRHHWGLGNIIENLPDSPAWDAKNSLGRGEKNRADHRHHALDAIVIALTSRHKLAAMHGGRTTVHHLDRETGEVVEYQTFVKDIPPPWELDLEAFRTRVAAHLAGINVSHSVRRGIRGGLHEETIYGKTDAHGKNGEFVVRKSVENLSMNEVNNIRDGAIKALVLERLQQHGIKPGRGEDKVPPKKMQEAMKDLRMKSGVPVKKVRLIKKDLTISRIREGRPDEVFVKPGSTHHLCIFEWTELNKKGQPKIVRDAVFVTMLDAAKRIKERKEIVSRVHPTRPDAKFVMSLSRGELIKATVEGKDQLLVMMTSVQTEVKARFALVTDAQKSDQKKSFNTSIAGIMSKWNARKITVDPLGRVRWAND